MVSQMYPHLKTHEVLYVKHVQRFLHQSYINKVIFEWNIAKINILCGLKNENKGFANKNFWECAKALFRCKLMPLIMLLILKE